MTLSIVDTSFVVSLGNERDLYHAACTAVYEKEAAILLPQPILAEVAYMLQREIGTRGLTRFLRQLPQTKYRVIPLEASDFLRVADLLEHYADANLDFADAVITAAAETNAVNRILTLDRRDFRMIRPRHVDYFEILPAL